MSRVKGRPSIKRLREALNYNPKTGELTWRIKPRCQPIRIGDKAGSRHPNGYIIVGIDGHAVRAHRAIFAMVKGRWPKADVDHEDTDGFNNRWRNLREANRSQNNANSKLTARNSVGAKGVTRMGKRFKAQIKINGRNMHLGMHSTVRAAHAAYMAKARELFGEFARAS